MDYFEEDDLALETEIQDELNEDNIFFKISNIAACYYCTSTESRFIEEKNMMHLYSPNIILESEYMLSKSVAIAYTFLRNDIPFV